MNKPEKNDHFTLFFLIGLVPLAMWFLGLIVRTNEIAYWLIDDALSGRRRRLPSLRPLPPSDAGFRLVIGKALAFRPHRSEQLLRQLVRLVVLRLLLGQLVVFVQSLGQLVPLGSEPLA